MKKISPKPKKKLQKKTPQRKQLFIIIGILIVSLFIIVMQTQQSSDSRSRAAITNCTTSDAEVAVNAEEQKMLDLVNTYRQQKGLAPVVFSTNLNRAAAWLSTDMSSKNYLDHTDSLGRTPGVRIGQCGGNYTAENIAVGFTTAQTAFNFWLGEPEHEANMLNPENKTMGIAHVGNYWTQDFGPAETGITPTTPAETPTTAVPSPVCLGGCPSTTPEITQPIPTTTEVPVSPTETSVSPAPSEEPSILTPTPISATPAPGGSGNSGGFLGLLLGLILLIIKFFAGLFS